MNEHTSIRIPADLKKILQIRAQLDHRTLSNQIESYLRLAVVADENQDLPLKFIRDILEAKAEREMGLARPFKI